MKTFSYIALLLLVAASGQTFAAGNHGGSHHAGNKQGAHASAYGKPGDPAKVTRTVKVDMTDNMRFSPSKIVVKRGETIKFVVKNSGKLKHEMVLGSIKELNAHAAMMRKNPEMEHYDPNQVSVDPGKTGDLIWQFNKSGTFDFACLQPGHYESGMVGKVAVK